jgi:hypothetical protein
MDSGSTCCSTLPSPVRWTVATEGPTPAFSCNLFSPPPPDQQSETGPTTTTTEKTPPPKAPA